MDKLINEFSDLIYKNKRNVPDQTFIELYEKLKEIKECSSITKNLLIEKEVVLNYLLTKYDLKKKRFF